MRKTLILFDIAHYGKSSIYLSKYFFVALNKIFFLGGRLGTILYFDENLALF